MNEKEIDELRWRTASSAILWARTGTGRITLAENFDEYAKVHATGPNPPSRDRAVSGRRLTAKRVALDCLFRLKPGEMERLDRELDRMALDVPDEMRRGFRR